MKKKPKQILAIIALISIIALIIAFFISAFFTSPNNPNSNFIGLLFGIITLPILFWGIFISIRFFKKGKTSDNTDIQQ